MVALKEDEGKGWFSLDQYLERVGLSRKALGEEANLEMLKTLNRAQVYNIPFENLDIPLGRGIDVKLTTVWEKVIVHKRGGYCFELNHLLYTALKALGFKVRRGLARIILPKSGNGGFTHLVSIVTLEQGTTSREYLVDAGSGQFGPRAPLALDDLGMPVRQESDAFRLVADNGRTVSKYGVQLHVWRAFEWQAGKPVEECWEPFYSFDPNLCVQDMDLVTGSFFVSNFQDPGNIFTNLKMAGVLKPEGSLYVVNMEVKTSRRVAWDDLAELGLVERDESKQQTDELNDGQRPVVIEEIIKPIQSETEWRDLLLDLLHVDLTWDHRMIDK